MGCLRRLRKLAAYARIDESTELRRQEDIETPYTNENWRANEQVDTEQLGIHQQDHTGL
jgi:hypothetical protein